MTIAMHYPIASSSEVAFLPRSKSSS